MGADLYIHKIYKPNQAKYEPLFNKWVEVRNTFPEGSKQHKASQAKVHFYYEKMYSKGYFRDSYNDSNLFNKFELSYWNNKFMSKAGYLTPKNAGKLLLELKSREATFKKNVKGLDLTQWEEGFTIKKAEKYFNEKYKNFKKFLRTAIKLNEKIDCSV